jgi:hypothetical protein
MRRDVEFLPPGSNVVAKVELVRECLEILFLLGRGGRHLLPRLIMKKDPREMLMTYTPLLRRKRGWQEWEERDKTWLRATSESMFLDNFYCPRRYLPQEENKATTTKVL